MSSSQSTTIVIISSGALKPSDDIYQKVVAALAFHDGEVRVRRPSTSLLEGWLIDEVGKFRTVVSFLPSNQHNNYDRDRSMVRDADLVMAFFPDEAFMEGGTGHVVQCALEEDIPVEAWAMKYDGSLTLVAEHDGRWTQAGVAWKSGRMVANTALNFKSLVAPSKRSPKRSAKPTSTGSGNTPSTGRGKSRTGSIFQVRSGSDPLPLSARSSSDT